MLARSDRGLIWWGCAVLGVVVLLRLYRLGEVPPGLYLDEVSYGYNAVRLLDAGVDEHGVVWPLFFKAFGEYKNPALIYLCVALFRLFGVSVWSLRLGAVLLSLLGCAGFAFWIRALTGSWRWGLVGATLGGLIPWYFPYGRIAFDAALWPALTSFALGCFVHSIAPGRSPRWAAAAGVLLGLSFYAYTAARLFAPLLAAAMLIVSPASSGNRGAWRSWLGRWAAPFSATMLLALAPALALLAQGETAWLFPPKKQPQFYLWSRPLGAVAPELAERYLDHFSLDFLALNGDPNLRHHTGFGGEMRTSMLALILIGGWTLVRERRGRRPSTVPPEIVWLLVFGMATFPLAAALADTRVHATRTLGAVPFFLALSVVGLRALWQGLRAWPRPRQRLGRFLLIAVLAADHGAYLRDYFAFYGTRARALFLFNLVDTVRQAVALSRQTHRPLFYHEAELFRFPLYVGFLDAVAGTRTEASVLRPGIDVPADGLLLLPAAPRVKPGLRRLAPTEFDRADSELPLIGLYEFEDRRQH